MNTIALSECKFNVGDYISHGAHGIGKICDIKEHNVSEQCMRFFEISFEKKNIKMMIPEAKIMHSGIRHLMKKSDVDAVFENLKEQSRNLRVIWNRRSKKYEKDLLSNDVYTVLAIIKDLYRNVNNPNRSYTEVITFDEAVDRVSSEISIVLSKDYASVVSQIYSVLEKYHETYQPAQEDEFDEKEDDSTEDEEEDAEDDDFEDEDIEDIEEEEEEEEKYGT